MKKFFILATYVVASLFATKAWAADSPTEAPEAPTKDVTAVKAIYCNTYTENNLGFDVSDATGWQELTLSGTNVRYTNSFGTATITNTAQTSYDCSGYPKFHFDVWAPEAGLKIYLKFKGTTFDYGISFNLNEGWNTIDADLAWWTADDRGKAWDFKDLKEIIFYDYQTQSDNSTVNKPFAFTNLYFWKDPDVDPATRPATAPAVPGIPEDKVYALFSATYQTNTYNFTPTLWGCKWAEYTYSNGQKIYYTDKMDWDAFTNWGADTYNFGKFDAFHVDVYVTVDSKIKVSFEATKSADFNTGATFELKANQWNSLKVDLLNAPYQTYDFKTVRYFKVEEFSLKDGELKSANGTPFALANAYFGYAENIINAVENVSVQGQPAVKKIVNGQLVIEKDGKRYNALGVEL